MVDSQILVADDVDADDDAREAGVESDDDDHAPPTVSMRRSNTRSSASVAPTAKYCDCSGFTAIDMHSSGDNC